MFGFCIPQANPALMGEFSTSYIENDIAIIENDKYLKLVIVMWEQTYLYM